MYIDAYLLILVYVHLQYIYLYIHVGTVIVARNTAEQ